MTTTQASERVGLQDQPLEILEAIEEAFAEHPTFGSSAYVLGQLRACLERRLERMVPRLGAAGELLEALAAASASVDHVVGDTTVRCAILHAHARLETGAPNGLPLADCEEILAQTADRLRQGDYDSPLNDGSLLRLGTEPHSGWLWTDEHGDDVFGRSYRRLLAERYQAVPVAPTDEEVAKLEEGGRLAHELLPTLAPSALVHAHILSLVPSAGGWEGVASASQFRLGGSIFLGRFLQSPWWVAEHLLHEALHQKLYDFRQGHLLLQMDAGGDREALKVASVWNSPRLNDANRWDVHRVYAAFHVYAHLALFGAVAEARAAEFEGTYGPIRGMTSSRKAVERAHFLGEQLTGQCWNHLGVAGQSMAEWLISVLNALDPAPPPRGAYLHLCLDLYEREAGQLAGALDEDGSLSGRLPLLAGDEIEGVRHVLASVDANATLDRLEHFLAGYAEDERGARFPELRMEIGKALREASPDGYLLGDAAADARLQELIARQSQRVFALLSGYPGSVADAKVRGATNAFRSSCRDEVGRLLATVAATVRAGGRILEVGTGAGVGTAWIAEGLDGRTDVEVISVEVDPALSRATRTWPWPSNIDILTADAIDVLPSLGRFDLVFADAAPVKYGSLERVLDALEPGGLLVIDDVGLGESTTEDQVAEKDTLRRALLEHPGLHAVELAASSGLIIASRRKPGSAG